MKKSFSLSNQTIKTNIQKLKKIMAEKNLDAMYISSFDPFLNEYVPMADNHRFYFTGFTGSMAESLVLASGKVRLYVDGRYHEQADMEVDASEIDVVKSTESTTGDLVKDVTSFNVKRLGYESDRTTLGFLKRLAGAAQETVALAPGELAKTIEFEKLPEHKEVTLINREFRGRDTLEKTRMIFKDESESMYLTALDTIAWITNCRGYHLPFLSSYYARALVTKEKVFVFVTPETPISAAAKKEFGIQFISLPLSDLPRELERIQNTLHLKTVWFDPNMSSAADFSMLVKIFGNERLVEKVGGLYDWQSIKEPVEIQQFEASFKRSDKAIYNTIKWVKDSLREGKRITELDLYQETSKRYQAEGSKGQSFNTIAGVGPNGSIMHYGSPSDEVIIKKDDLILLDSGGYFDGGFATDCTRAFLGGTIADKPDPKKVEIYTLVLKGLLNCANAVFPEGTKGIVLDGLARAPMRKKGYDFAHGTGHGVGIHVHEPGVRISSISNVPMKAGQVVSIEPGIYLPGFGGVRLENIYHVEKHPTHAGMLHFVGFVFIGFDPALVDMKLLNDEEKVQLEEYEAECLRRGTSLRALK